jgi:cytochrome b
MSSNPPSTIKAWDPLVRIFHWSLVFFFILAYLTEDNLKTLHIWAGYAVALLIIFRLVWGMIGTRHARFSSFVRSPSIVLDYIRQMRHFNAPHYLGHNPAAGAMIIALLLSLIMVSITGMSIIAAEGQGPLAGTVAANPNADWMEEIHEFFAHLTLLLVMLHIAGVIFGSFLEGQNLPRAMLTGRKQYRDDYVDTPARETRS